MAFILTHYETGVKNFVTTVEIPFQWQRFKTKSSGNLSLL